MRADDMSTGVVSFDPAKWPGYTSDQINLIRLGFESGLSSVCNTPADQPQSEEHAEDSRMGRIDALAAERDDPGHTAVDEQYMRAGRDAPRFNEAGEWI